MIEEEEKSDKQLREQFKERWTRTSSDKLTQPMRDESMKYKQILDTAINADRIVQEKFEKHKQAIDLLSKSTVSLISQQQLQKLPIKHVHVIHTCTIQS